MGFHLVSDRRQILLETEEEVNQTRELLGERGDLKNELQLPGKPRVPPNAQLVSRAVPQEPPAEAQTGMELLAHELPAVVTFKLRMAGLGFFVSLRRKGYTIPLVSQDVLRLVL